MKDEQCCEQCDTDPRKELELLLACPLLTLDEKMRIAEIRHHKILIDEFTQKYGRKG